MNKWANLLLILIGLHCALPAFGNEAESTNAPPAEKSLKELMTDPVDGDLDLSQWLGTASGILPVPIIIAEPAVGYGGGLALLYFHDSIQNNAKKMKEKNPDGTKKTPPPPSISGVAAIGTENGTWGGAAFHMGVWKEDTIRYIGAAGYVSVNYDYYTSSGQALPVNLDAAFLLQQATFRLGKSNFFMGGNYKFLSSTASLETATIFDPPLRGDDETLKSGGLGGILAYDSRDNIFTPNRGLSSKAEWTHYDSWLGSDNQFDVLNLKNRTWLPLTESLVLGLRGDGAFSGGDIPFYMKPFILMRGIPAMRYQGDHVLTAEAELRWDFTQRWSLLGFAGAGWTAEDSLSDFGNSDAIPAGGFGFRYLLAHMFNLRTGIDIGFSEEDRAIYFTIGSAWAL